MPVPYPPPNVGAFQFSSVQFSFIFKSNWGPDPEDLYIRSFVLTLFIFMAPNYVLGQGSKGDSRDTSTFVTSCPVIAPSRDIESPVPTGVHTLAWTAAG